MKLFSDDRDAEMWGKLVSRKYHNYVSTQLLLQIFERSLKIQEKIGFKKSVTAQSSLISI